MQDIIREMMDSLNQEKPVLEMEHCMTINGTERWQHWIGHAMFDDQSGKLVEYQVVGRDITERKQVEAELRRAKEAAEAATRAKSEFLANMSHEIRTPMNGVVGMTELLLNTELSSKQHEYAQIIYQSTDALQTIINDILDFSKIEAGKLSLEPVEFDLEYAVLEVARLLSMTAVSKGFELIVRYAPNAPRHFIGDAGRIRQILTNLTGNAIKFTEQGHVLINVDCETQEAELADMVFHIEDTGIGIPPDKVNTIFEQFTQADTTTTRRFGGTGLGLAISKQLVKLMNGEIHVVSELGKGSTFSFTVPLPFAMIHKPDQSSSIAQTFQETELLNFQCLQDTRILVVDDNSVNQRILIEQLEDLKIRAQAVDSGEAALNHLRKAQRQHVPYWLAIIDYFMPVMDGEQLGKEIKQDSEIGETILVMLSSADFQKDRQQLQQAGFSAHLLKPLPRRQLQQTLLTLRNAFEQSQSSLEFITMEKVNKFQLRMPQKIYLNLPVLLVEDNEVNYLVAMNMLDKLGCQVTYAMNGLQAIEKLKQQRFAVIFMDIHMPEMDGFEATRKIREGEAQVSQTEQKHQIIIAMTANAMQGDAEHCLAAGMDDYIAKPITIERVFDVLSKYRSSYQSYLPNLELKSICLLPKSKPECAKMASVEIFYRSLPSIKRGETIKELKTNKVDKIDKKVLLVEDNPVGCMVATNMLEELGCLVEIAEDGKQAVEKCVDNDYELILMDIQMPVMDGIEASKLIRRHLQTPIIAVTANHQSVDVERYIAIGMNDCLPKPLKIETLRMMIDKYTSSAMTELPIFDTEQAKRIAIGNLNILKKIIEKFALDTPKQLEKLQAAVQAGNQKDAERITHSIKGSAQSVGASRLGELAFIGEQASKQGDLAQVETLLNSLNNEFAQLQSLWKHTDWETLM